MEIEASKYPNTSSQLDIIRECLDYGWTDIVITIPYMYGAVDTLNWNYALSVPEKKQWLEAVGIMHKKKFRVVERQIISPNSRTEYHWLFEDQKHAALFSLRWA